MSATSALGEGVAGRVDPDDPRSIDAVLADVRPEELRRLGRTARQLLDEDDVTYHPGGAAAVARWRVDPLPLVLAADEWAEVEAGVVQRTELLDLVLADLYGPRDLLRTGALPPELVHGHPGFLRALDGVRLPGLHQLTTCATDLLRDHDGAWVPVADRTQVPAGAAYALENRSVTSRLLPELHRAARVERLAPWLRRLRATLRAVAPGDPDEARIAVLGGGPASDSAFEHGNLAGLLGHPVVEGADLAVRDGRVWLRSVGGEPARIDVLFRRVDAWWCDPLELRPDSTLGPPGLVEAVRRGGVSVVNGLGTGVLENAGLQAYLPDLCRLLLGQDLRLAPARTVWCGEPEGLREVLARFDDLVVKPVARGGGDGPVDTARLDAAGRAELRARVEHAPHAWVGQERVGGPRERALGPTGDVTDVRVVLRTFTVAGERSYTAMRGGLARVSDADRLAVAGTVDAGRAATERAWSKDVWVLGGDHEAREDFWLHRGPRPVADAAESVVSARSVENMLWLGRYAERAEATVRLLRAVDDRRAEVGGGTDALDEVADRLLAALVAVTGTGPATAATRRSPGAELTALVLDADRAGTLADSVARLLDAARAVRDQLSGDAWPVLTALEHQLLGDDEQVAALATGARGPAHGRAALGHVLTLLLALHGLGAESLVRDTSWQFLEAGRRLERAQQLLGLLRATVVPPDGGDTLADDAAVTSLLLESVLVTCESVITYRRRYRSRAQLVTVLDLLLLDAGNPRSLRWQVDRLLDLLPHLPTRADGSGTAVADAVRATSAALQAVDGDQLDGPDLGVLLERLDQHLQRAASELARTVFAPPPAQRALVEARGADGGPQLT